MAARKSVLSLVVLLGLGAPALACQGTGTPQLDENFKTPDPGWGRPDDVGTFTPNGLALTAPVMAAPGGSTGVTRWEPPIGVSRR